MLPDGLVHRDPVPLAGNLSQQVRDKGVRIMQFEHLSTREKTFFVEKERDTKRIFFFFTLWQETTSVMLSLLRI